ncbi:MAG: ADP-forming succinate--CoA ligase subunit beta [bacterium]
MKLHEYQAKHIFASADIPVPREQLVNTPSMAKNAAMTIGLPVIIKAQVLVGGRGKAGGVKRVDKLDDVEPVSEKILGMTIKGLKVTKLLVSECVDIKSEFYLGVTVDRSARQPVLLASAAGGIEIEEVAKTAPEKILRVEIDPLLGLLPFQTRSLGLTLLGDLKLTNAFINICQHLYQVFVQRDCSLAEINPLVLTGNNQLLALDAKINFDDNALFRHPDNEALRALESEEPKEVEAKNAGLSYVKLSGNVGCVVNGAGLAMATMDLIKQYGGEPANFLDVGGSSSPEKMITALNIILSDSNVKTILVNIFGGITRCDDIAQGLIAATRETNTSVPIVARLVGTNADQAKTLLKDSPVLWAETMSDAVKLAIAKAREAR